MTVLALISPFGKTVALLKVLSCLHYCVSLLLLYFVSVHLEVFFGLLYEKHSKTNRRLVWPFHIKKKYLPGVQMEMNQARSQYMAKAGHLWKDSLIILSLKYLKAKFFQLYMCSIPLVYVLFSYRKKDWPLIADLLFCLLYFCKTFV